ncbi:B-cell receptor CD22-like [Pelobates cultripes]|uniref:B-cell receptor CD22-like n=1 Tax=Pelobates cultripes TaxID=61616 RepID=A0AAD1T6R4_PELCU|nr:B-cell receptor CD22-like [Pelobates cultripes]
MLEERIKPKHTDMIQVGDEGHYHGGRPKGSPVHHATKPLAVPSTADKPTLRLIWRLTPLQKPRHWRNCMVSEMQTPPDIPSCKLSLDRKIKAPVALLASETKRHTVPLIWHLEEETHLRHSRETGLLDAIKNVQNAALICQKMNHPFDSVKMLFYLFILQGWFPISFCEDWSFRFPKSMRVLKHSNVTIPCNFTSPEGFSDVHIIWYIYNTFRYSQVFNSRDPSAVTPEYRGRTFLVGNETKSCSLRINNVTKNEQFYPGIDTKINSYDLYKQTVNVKLIGNLLYDIHNVRNHTESCSKQWISVYKSCRCFNSCKIKVNDWIFRFPKSIQALSGSCVEIPCSFTYKEDDVDFNLIWFMYHIISYPQIFNKRMPSAVEPEYKGQTSMVGNKTNSCSLRIDNVQSSEYYYPGIDKDINSYKVNDGKRISVEVSDLFFMPAIKGADDIQEGKTISIYCSVTHTCASSPPSLEWNKAGHPISVRHEDISGGYWRVQSEIRYSPSYQDHNTSLGCTATFQNGKRFYQYTILNIKFPPQNMNIHVLDKDEMREGDNVTLQCITRANPAPSSYEWYKVQKNSTAKLKEIAEKLQILNVNLDNNKYYCSVRNELGTGNSSIIELPVKYKAKGVRINLEKQGHNVKMECVFSSGNPEPTQYAWLHNGSLIRNKTEKILIIKATVISSGNYECEVSNDVGKSLSEPVTVTVTDPETVIPDDSHPKDMTLILVGVAGNRNIPEQILMSDQLYENIHKEPVLYGNIQPMPHSNSHLTDQRLKDTRNPDKRSDPDSNDVSALYSKPQKRSEDVLYVLLQHGSTSQTQNVMRQNEDGSSLYTTVKH